MGDKLHNVNEMELHGKLLNEDLGESETKVVEGNDKIENISVSENIVVDDCLSSSKIYENDKNINIGNEKKRIINYSSSSNNHKDLSYDNHSNVNHEKKMDFYKNSKNDKKNIDCNKPIDTFIKVEDENIAKIKVKSENKMRINENEVNEDNNNLNENENSLCKNENEVNKDDNNINKNSLSEEDNNLSEEENLSKEENNLNENNLSKEENNLNENNFSKEENNLNEDENSLSKEENNLNEDENSLSKEENNLNENNLSKEENNLSEKENSLSKEENNLSEKENNLNENNFSKEENNLNGEDNNLSISDKYLSADENNITKEKLDNIDSNYMEEINSNKVDFEEINFFDNNFFDFQKAENPLKKNNSLIDIYNEMKNFEEDFLDYLERTYENVEEDGFIRNEEHNSVDHVDLNSVESISSFFNDSSISNLNVTQMKQYLSDSINSFIEEQKKLNKKIRINKNYFNIENYSNTLPPNPSKKIFKEYKK